MSETEPHDDAQAQAAPELTIPALALVVIASGTIEDAQAFAARHFSPAETVLVEPTAFEQDDIGETRGALARRLADGQLTVALIHHDDATLTAALARMAHHYDVSPIAVTLGHAIPLARFPIGPRSYEAVHPLATVAQWEAAHVRRAPLACDLRAERGPFDIIGDVHGCYDELVTLLAKLGYERDGDGMRHPAGRRAIFVGDLVDRGPGVVQVARLVMRMVAEGQAFCAPGNHDIKLMRALEGRHVYVAHGLQESLDQIAALPDETERANFIRDFVAFIRRIPPYLMLEDGSLVVAHAGLPERYHGRISERIRVLVFYGETTGWEDEYGHPIRIDWAAEYHGAAAVVYGHTPHREAPWRNNTIDIDTGCVHGGRLTAVRWPERDVVSVAASREYARRKGGLR